MMMIAVLLNKKFNYEDEEATSFNYYRNSKKQTNKIKKKLFDSRCTREKKFCSTLQLLKRKQKKVLLSRNF